MPTLTHALSVAAERFTQDATAMRQAADILRRGGEVGPFAPGEGGALAAERLAKQFEKQVAETRALNDKIEE